jgi:hypothetical protein
MQTVSSLKRSLLYSNRFQHSVYHVHQGRKGLYQYPTYPSQRRPDARRPDNECLLAYLVAARVRLIFASPSETTTNKSLSSQFHRTTQFYMGLYGALGVAQAVFTFAL